MLTEPEWFKGSIDDLRSVRQALAGMPNRPAVLRKEFVFDEYQILEARLAGADVVLLIVEMLDVESLTRLYKYSQSLNMEPLVEVNTVEEMETAIQLGSKVIGVNSRNLTSFEVDMETTTRLMDKMPKGTTLCALSGISSPQDVCPYQQIGVGAVLVGEALMKAHDTAGFIAELLGGDKASVKPHVQQKLLVKICGTRSADAAATAIRSGADLIRIIQVPRRKRCVSNETALQIAKVVHETPKLPSLFGSSEAATDLPKKATSFFEHTTRHHLRHSKCVLLVGVFQNQPLNYVLQQQELLSLDLVQLHGSEPLEWASLIPCPVIHSFAPEDPELGTRGRHSIALLDSGAGGTGQQLGAKRVAKALESDREVRIMLAGGLNDENIAEMVERLGKMKSRVVAVDVSSGVETDGKQDLGKIEKFIAAAKGVELS